jgi:hypothetical protein
MKRVSKTVLAASAFTCATLLSFGWCDQGGIFLSVESAQARVARQAMPMTATSVARRQPRRGYYGTAAAVGAGIAAAGTAAAVAATSPGWGSGPYYTGTGYFTGGPYYQGPGYYGGGPYAAYGSYGYPAQDYATRNGFVCHPGTMVRLDDGRMYPCQ